MSINVVESKRRLSEYKEPLLGLLELSEVLGLSRQVVQQRRSRGSPPLPTAWVQLRMGPVWTKSDVYNWLEDIPEWMKNV